MKKKYKANIGITSYGDNTIILFGYFFFLIMIKYMVNVLNYLINCLLLNYLKL